MSTPATSVIIPCHNCAETLPIQLEALARQEDAEPFEVVVVCNRCTDDTEAVARAWADRLDLHVVVADRLASVSYARNRGAAEARGEFLVFCDGDDAVQPHFVAQAVRAVREAGPIIAISHWTVDMSVFETGYSAIMQKMRTDGFSERPFNIEEMEPPAAGWPVLPGGCFAITREWFVSLGGFDPSADPGAEDNDLALRAEDAGLCIRTLNSTHLAYRISWSEAHSPSELRARARSVALVRTRMRRWHVVGAQRPYWDLARACAARARAVVRGQWSADHPTRSRLATALGIAEGYTTFAVLGRIRPRRLGEGLNDE